MKNLKELQSKIEKVLNERLPSTAWRKVSMTKVLGGDWIKIQFAGADYLINGVQGQRPLAASLRLDEDLELKPQGFGGSGGRRIYFSPDKENPKEKYLALSGVTIPFRTPKKEEKKVLDAIGRFVDNWVKAIKEKDPKFYRNTDHVNYANLTGQKVKAMAKKEVKNMKMQDLKKVYDNLKKGDEIEVTYDSSIRKDSEAVLRVSKAHTKVGKAKVERVTFVNVDNPKGVRYYLYNREGKIYFAVGDLAAVITNVNKEFKDTPKVLKTNKEQVKTESKNKVMAKKTTAKTTAKKTTAKTTAKTTKRSAPVKAAKTTAKAPAKTTIKSRTRLSTAQKIASGKDNVILTGCLELASKCLRKGLTGKEEKKIANQMNQMRMALSKSPDSKTVASFKKSLKANNQKLFKDLKSCTNNAGVKKFFKDASESFKTSSVKELPDTINW
jgi:hypothetical protein